MGNNSNHLLLSCSLFPSRELKNQFRGFFCLLFENLFHLATFEICDKAEKGKHFGANKKPSFLSPAKHLHVVKALKLCSNSSECVCSLDILLWLMNGITFEDEDE